MAINHIDDFEFIAVQLLGCSRAAILDNYHIEALISQAAYGRRNALIGKYSSDNDIFDSHIAQYQAQVGACQSAVRCLG